MEFLEGEDLGSLLLRERRIPYARATEYLLQALEAVGEAHQRGIVHRDIKPQNLFLTNRGIVKVVDFGLAKDLSLTPVNGGSGLGTQTKVMMGSPHYMSPEQVRSARRVDARADIWALGATLYHLVTGLPPYSAPNLFLLCARIINEPAPSVERRVPGLPPLFDAVLQKCLRKNAQERYASCAELAEALRDALEGTCVVPPKSGRSSSPPVTPLDPTSTAPMATVQQRVITLDDSDIELEIDFEDATRTSPPSTAPTERMVLPPRKHR
jgi:serine/threonine-protein kinase